MRERVRDKGEWHVGERRMRGRKIGRNEEERGIRDRERNE
jgi:hypothetical protein